ncbi:hypothetical protein CH375_23065 [Leptospira ellisii]|uniref:Uncharacterized protein n=1 Tax=Leptospira ellisii TaxID=2023197 RepID=A0A2N0BEK9_9LEPT|nr:hypothetical protein CH379_13360 [Leptospira ellisii]PKA02445.1 hypothetical protein CH375_23065 [Leptospira ellisii]
MRKTTETIRFRRSSRAGYDLHFSDSRSESKSKISDRSLVEFNRHRFYFFERSRKSAGFLGRDRFRIIKRTIEGAGCFYSYHWVIFCSETIFYFSFIRF